MTGAQTVRIVVNGVPTAVPAAVSVAAALALRGQYAVRVSRPSAAPRGVFCGMGSCYECVATVDGLRGVRTCLTPVRAGMRVDTEESR